MLYRREKKPPWDPESRFYRLKSELETLQHTLNRDLHLTDRNTSYYIRSRGTSRSYVQLHSVLALCDMALHREYIAFLPWDQRKPAGPVDGRELPPPPANKATYWEDNARVCFKAAKQFNDLARACLEEGVLVETPVVGFAMFYVLQIGVLADPNPLQLRRANSSSDMVPLLPLSRRRELLVLEWRPG
jgi:hypothetical protein